MEVLQVEGRDAVRLKSGRVVWRDGARDEWGAFIAGLRPWTLFGTLTYDRTRHAQWLASLRKRSGYRDGGAEVVPLDSAENHFRRFVDAAASVLGHRVEYVNALEFHKDGWPHHHALLDVGTLHYGDIANIGQRWFLEHGFAELEVPRNVVDVCAYAAKYLSKDVMLGGRVMLSPGLRDGPVYQSRARELTASWRP